MEKKTNILSILSLILGIIGLFTILAAIGIIPCIAGLILGIVALVKKQNKVIAIIGIIASSIGIFLVAVALLYMLIASSSDAESISVTNSEEAPRTEIAGDKYVEHEESSEVGNDWADTFTPITDFRYTIDKDNKTITLIRYEGEDTKILLSPIYSLDGEDYALVSIGDDACFLSETYITSVIIPNGVTEIGASCFNSCSSLEYVYLPSTLIEIPSSFFSYLGKYEVFCNSEISLPTDKDTNDYQYIVDSATQAEELGESTARALNGLLGGLNSSSDAEKTVKIYFGGTDEQWKNLISN